MNQFEKEIEELNKSKFINGIISIKAKETQEIKGSINIIEQGCKLDKLKSKFLLNTNSSQTIEINEYNSGQSIQHLSQEFSFYKPAGTYYLHALIVDNLGHFKELVSSCITTNGIKFAFKYTGKVQSVQLMPGKYKFEVWGAEGGTTDEYSMNPGRGGYSSGILNLKKETTLYVYVGECPKSSKGLEWWRISQFTWSWRRRINRYCIVWERKK